MIRQNSRPGGFESRVGDSITTYFGLAFERMCLKNFDAILEALDIQPFEVLHVAPYFKQGSRGANHESQKELQIDILVLRKGDILTLIECKYSKSPIGVSVADQVQQKVNLLRAPARFTVEKVLIAASGATKELSQSGKFHRILGLDAVL